MTWVSVANKSIKTICKWNPTLHRRKRMNRGLAKHTNGSLLINTELREDQRKFERKKVIGGIVIDKVRINIKTKKK